MGFTDRLQHAWNAFMSRDRPVTAYDYGMSSSSKLDSRTNPLVEKTFINTLYNRIAMDCASIQFKHVRLDSNGNYENTIKSGLNRCLGARANKDQISRAFIHDLVYSMLVEGYIAVVPIDTDIDPDTGSYTINSLRVCKILQWYPDHVQVEGYNDQNGKMETIICSKKNTAIIENPFYAVMNGRNSTVQRLMKKYALMDKIDEQISNGKIDLIIQLPYALKDPLREAQAKRRQEEIAVQLKGSTYGIAYIDATEKVTQLNRSLDNNFLNQVQYLTDQTLSQLGLTMGILDGTASADTMSNYYNRIIDVIVGTIAETFMQTFLTNTAITQGQAIIYYRDPFRIIPPSTLPDLLDKLTRNEIISSNEARSKIGLLPIKDELADELRNKNLNPGDNQEFASTKNINTEE